MLAVNMGAAELDTLQYRLNFAYPNYSTDKTTISARDQAYTPLKTPIKCRKLQLLSAKSVALCMDVAAKLTG